LEGAWNTITLSTACRGGEPCLRTDDTIPALTDRAFDDVLRALTRDS